MVFLRGKGRKGFGLALFDARCFPDSDGWVQPWADGDFFTLKIRGVDGFMMLKLGEHN